MGSPDRIPTGPASAEDYDYDSDPSGALEDFLTTVEDIAPPHGIGDLERIAAVLRSAGMGDESREIGRVADRLRRSARDAREHSGI